MDSRFLTNIMYVLILFVIGLLLYSINERVSDIQAFVDSVEYGMIAELGGK